MPIGTVAISGLRIAKNKQGMNTFRREDSVGSEVMKHHPRYSSDLSWFGL